MWFDEYWCAQCQRDAAWREDENSVEPCDILSRSFIFDINDPEYPTEWIQDDVAYPHYSNPRCTAFLAITDPGSTYVADPRQYELNFDH